MLWRLVVYVIPVLFLEGCTYSLPQEDYYGALRIEEYTFRLVFSTRRDDPSLIIVGVRGKNIAIHNVSFEKDTLRFSRKDGFATYKGYYDANTGTITGDGPATIALVIPFALNVP